MNPITPPFRRFVPLRLLAACALWLPLASGLARAEFDEKTVARARQSTVRVVTLVDGELRGHGSGFIISSDGHVVTNFHVVKGAEEVAVFYGSGLKVYVNEARVLVTAPAKDLAILRCSPIPNSRPIIVANRETTGSQAVMALGFPGVLDAMAAADGKSMTPSSKDGEFTVSPEDAALHATVSFSGNVGKEMPLESGFGGSFNAIAHSAKISEGNSGGPLIDRDGRLVGINVQSAANRMGADYAFAIHASELVSLARTHAIPISVTSSKASAAGALSGLQILLFVVVALFAVVMFLLVLRKPRTVMVDAMSKVLPSRRGARQAGGRAHGAAAVFPAPPPSPAPAGGGGFRLRGRDPLGRSYDVAFRPADFARTGGRLVVGRNGDLSQLLISHDSVSRQHTTLTLSGGTVLVEDRNSGNGTQVNGREMVVGQPAMPLHAGDRLTLGEVELVFEVMN